MNTSIEANNGGPRVSSLELQTTATPDDIGERVPKDLIEHNNWLVWRKEQVRGREAKVPMCASTGRRASSTDPRTWCPFDDAVRAWRSYPRYYVGLGFVFSRSVGMVGVDLDDCLTAGGEVKPWAAGVVERLSETYCEISPGGFGLKLWARGSLPNNLPGVKVADGAIELYFEKRFFTVTGRAFRGAPLQVEDYGTDLKLLYDHLSCAGRKLWPLQPLPGGRIPHGQQHSTLVSIAGTLRARRVAEPAILACLMAVNECQCEKPGPPEHVARIVRSTRTWGPR